MRAQNSKKNNFNPKKIERHIAYIDNKLEEYAASLAEQDNDSKENKKLIQAQIKKHEQRKAEYNKLQQQLEETGETQISTSDPDSRQMIIRNMITEVAYNVQTTVDAKHNIPIDFKTTNANDSKAMGNMLQRAKTILKSNDFTALYDKGYHTGSEFKAAAALGIDVMVAVPGVASNAPNPAFNVEHFIYNSVTDTYTCPANEELKTNGNSYKKDRGKSTTLVKHYKTTACINCELKQQCTRNTKGRLIERPENAEFIEQNYQRIEANKDVYKLRQAIVEHPYGTIKRQWDFSYIMTKRFIKRADADIGLMFTAYNLRRIINIIGKNEFKKYLQVLLSFLLSIISLSEPFKSILNYLKMAWNYFENKFEHWLKQSIFKLNLI